MYTLELKHVLRGKRIKKVMVVIKAKEKSDN